MSFTFRPAKRENVPLLLGVAGGTGSGKTYSALMLARGITGGEPFAFVDTENGRAKHYADLFPEMRHGEIHAPFRPDKYADAIQAGAAEFPVVVVDSMSHEWAGDGGCLDWHDEIMGGDQKKNLAAWIEPKKSHKRMVTRLLQLNAHVILCFRAEPKVEQVKGNDGKWRIVPKPSITGLDGWIPITEKMLPYELTASFLLMADQPGVPRPIKLQEQHKPLVPLDKPLDEKTGALLAEWARGSSTSEPASRPAGSDVDELTIRLTRMLAGNTRAIAAIRTHREGHTAAQHETWLKRQIERVEAAAAEAGGASEANPAPDAGEGAPSDADLVEQPDGAMALTVPAEVRSRMETGQ